MRGPPSQLLSWLLLVATVAAPFLVPAPGERSDVVARPFATATELSKTLTLGYSPSQVRRAYGVDRLALDGSGQVIGIVTAYHSPAIVRDLAEFARIYQLRKMNGTVGGPACTIRDGPHPCFQEISDDGSAPYQEDWGSDASLGVEWSHAIAPGADIVLVESSSPTLPALIAAVDQAVEAGAHVVAMSWGAPEFPGETEYDGHFRRSGVSFIGASGDWIGGVTYPAASPYVVGVGGTTLRLDEAGAMRSEVSWPGTSRGSSAYEPAPVYQRQYLGQGNQGRRVVPDVAYSADPQYGFPVLNSASRYSHDGWLRLGGTSAGAPQWAAIVALANQLKGRKQYLESGTLLATLYRASLSPRPPLAFRAELRSSDARCRSCSVDRGRFSATTGLGTPVVDRLVPLLAAAPPPT